MEPKVDPDSQSGTNVIQAEPVTAATATMYTSVVRLSNMEVNFQKTARRISSTSRMMSVRGVPRIRMANGIDIVTSNSRTVSLTIVANVFTTNQTRQPASAVVASK